MPRNKPTTDRIALDNIAASGIDNQNRETTLPAGAVRTALNVDIDKGGNSIRRQGTIRRITGTDCHSLWTDRAIDYALFVDNGTLFKLDFETALANAVATLQSNNKMSYCEFNGEVYYGNGADKGIVTNQGIYARWGLSLPPSPFAVGVQQGGGFAEGQYQVTYTYYDVNGIESGAPIATVVDVPANGSISLMNIPQNPDAEGVWVWLSSAHGDVLFRALQIPNGTTDVTFGKLECGEPLDKQFLDNPVPATQLTDYKGRVWFSIQNFLFYTEAMAPHLYHPGHNFFVLPEQIIATMSVEDGLYIASSYRTWFLLGGDPRDMQLTMVNRKGVIPGTMLRAPAHVFGNAEGAFTGHVAFWWDTDGVPVIGGTSGRIKRLTDGSVELGNFTSGATVYRERDGIEQILASMEGQRIQSDNIHAGDSVVAEVIKGEVKLPDNRYTLDLTPNSAVAGDAIADEVT